MAAKTADVSVTETVESDNQTVTAKGAGVEDLDGKLAQMSVSVPNVGTLQERTIGTALYIQVPTSERSRLTLGSAWAQLDLNQFMQAETGMTFTQMTDAPQTAGQYLAYLAGISSGSVEDLGPALVRGAPTTEYAATVNLNKAAAREPAFKAAVQAFEAELGPSQVPVTVWLDAAGRLRQFDMNLVLIGATADIVFDLWGFGAPVRVEVPPPSQVAILGSFPPAPTTP
jgi:hypothetical protein